LQDSIVTIECQGNALPQNFDMFHHNQDMFIDLKINLKKENGKELACQETH
jgi:hypothetical protein